jgi:hypothetical protein
LEDKVEKEAPWPEALGIVEGVKDEPGEVGGNGEPNGTCVMLLGSMIYFSSYLTRRFCGD